MESRHTNSGGLCGRGTSVGPESTPTQRAHPHRSVPDKAAVCATNVTILGSSGCLNEARERVLSNMLKITSVSYIVKASGPWQLKTLRSADLEGAGPAP